MIVELDKRIRQELLELYDRMLHAEELCVGQDLEKYYHTFRQKWEPEKLLELDGEALLNAMHGPGNESLAYWLERKNDEDFLSKNFGGIAGGSAFKFGLFRKKATDRWTTGSEQKQIELDLEQAIERAKQHRKQLVAGCKLLADFPKEGGDNDYERLQKEMDLLAPDVSNKAWGHKYFCLLYPDKLDDYHVTDYQDYHLARLLQVLPLQVKGRYVAASRFMAIARDLKMAVNTLTELLNRRHNNAYWRVSTQGWKDNKSYWEEMQTGNYCSIGWDKIGNLAGLISDKSDEQALRVLLEQAYPDDSKAVITKSVHQIGDFIWSIKKGDLVLASDGAMVLGIGQITGDYFYDHARAFPHCRPVTWLSLTPWSQPDQNPSIEGNLTTVHRIERVRNLVETEKRVLNTKYPLPITIPEEIDADNQESLYEGTKKQIYVNSYERNREARDQCIKHYGPQCVICGFDFEKIYGGVGKGVIHVHHLKPLSDIGEKYRVDPVNDLRPVCPNCHVVIHHKSPPYSIDEVITMIRNARSE